MLTNDPNNLLEASKEFEIKALRDQVDKLKHELIRCQILLKEIDEDADPNMVSDQEVICVQEISKLRTISNEERPLTSEECKNLDLLHKNLKLARGQSERVTQKDKASKMSSDDLEKLIKG